MIDNVVYYFMGTETWLAIRGASDNLLLYKVPIDQNALVGPFGCLVLPYGSYELLARHNWGHHIYQIPYEEWVWFRTLCFALCFYHNIPPKEKTPAQRTEGPKDGENYETAKPLEEDRACSIVARACGKVKRYRGIFILVGCRGVRYTTMKEDVEHPGGSEGWEGVATTNL